VIKITANLLAPLLVGIGVSSAIHPTCLYTNSKPESDVIVQLDFANVLSTGKGLCHEMFLSYSGSLMQLALLEVTLFDHCYRNCKVIPRSARVMYGESPAVTTPAVDFTFQLT